MIPNPFNGKFFAFEGIDGCGKTLKLKMADEWLRQTPSNQSGSHSNHVVKIEKEPGKERFWGAKIYAELAKPNGLHTTDLYGFQSWYARDSKSHMSDTIRRLEVGSIVLMDRFRPSMVFGVPEYAVSTDARAEALKELMYLNQSILGEEFIWPDVIFVFDVSPETALLNLIKKAEKQGKEIVFDEHEKIEKLNVVRSNYLLFARMYPNCHIIDSEGPPEEVFEKVKKIIEPFVLKIPSVI